MTQDTRTSGKGSGKKQPDARMTRALIVFLVGLLVMLGGAGAYVWSLRTGGPDGGAQQANAGAVQVGGPFELVDHKGQTRTEADFAGQHMLTYFGYTYCPDVCPTSLSVMTQALDLLEEQAPEVAAKIVPVFVTVDPERDDVSAMASYAEHFHPRMVALTGGPEQIAAAAKAYRVYYRKVEDDSATDYLVDHSSFIYLMGPDGLYVSHFLHNATAQEIADGLKEQVKS